MTNFWFIVVGMLLVSSLFIFWPLLPFNRRKLQCNYLGQKQENIDIFRDRLQELESEKDQGNLDESTFTQLKTELEKSLLADVDGERFEQINVTPVSSRQWLLSGLVAVLIVISSLALYLNLGRSADYVQYLVLKETNVLDRNQATDQAPDFEQAIVQLKAKLQQDPSDIDKWFLLAHSYSAIEQYAKSAQIFSQIAELIGQDDANFAAVKGSYAQAVYLASGEQMTTEVNQAVAQALSADPLEPNALLLQGIEAYSQENYKQAITYWQKAKQKAPAAQQQQFLDPAILAAQDKLADGGEQAVSTAVTTTTPTTVSASARITINLDIAAVLKNQVSADQSIFVFAKASGGRMPLAAERLSVKDLPTKIELNDAKAVMPTAKLSSAQLVDITARISFSGQAIAQPGDLYATIEKVAVANDGKSLDLMIDQIVR